MESTQFIISRDEAHLAHHGVKGQKWGVRRYQNEDGSLTAEGHQKYSQLGWEARQMYKKGTITKEQKQKAMKADNAFGKVDSFLNFGHGRRIREFRERHKKGIMGVTAASGVLGTVAVGVLTGGAALPMVQAGAAAVGSLIGTGLGNFVNRAVLDYGYNRKLDGTTSGNRVKKAN